MNKRVDVVMKTKFQFYKNIILVVASALTLIAVTFAWFSTSFHNGVGTITQSISADLIKVDFYEKSGSKYVPMNGDIELDGAESGKYSQYKMVITTFTKDALNLSFGIDDLPKDMNADLKNAVCIKYSLYAATKNADGSFTEGICVSSTEGNYVSLSTLTNGEIFNSLSLGNYQQADTDKDYFVVYYEIGLSESAGNNIQNMDSSLGSVRFNAKVANT